MNYNPDDETSCTTQYQDAFLENVENEYCAKPQWLSVDKLETAATNNPFSTMASRSGQTSFDQYDFSSNNDECLTLTNVAEMTLGLSNRAVHLLTAARLYLNSPPEEPQNWGQVNPNHNDYHSDPIEISCTFWLPDIIDW